LGVARAERSSPSAAQVYLDEVLEAAADAARRVGGWQERNIAIGGTALRLRFAGDALLDVLFPPLAHLACAPAPDGAGVTLAVWDSASTGVAPPAVPWADDDLDYSGHVRGLGDDDGIHAYHHPRLEILTLYDGTTATGAYWTQAAASVPWNERSAPLRTLFHLVLAGRRRHLVHAGAVGTESAAVLLGGVSGSGKSTTSLACVDAGLGYLGDDYVVVSLDPRPTAHSLFTTAKVAPEALERFPAFAGCVDETLANDDKVVLDLTRERGERILVSAPIAAVVLPRVRGTGPTELRSMRRSEAVLALAPSTIIQMPHRSTDALGLVTKLLEDVPGYRLELGADTRDSVELLRGLIGAA
jgi:hypothetical protein